MSEKTGPVLRWAEERGQNRELKTDEVKATTGMSVIETGALALVAFCCVLVFQALTGRGVGRDAFLTALLTAVAIGVLAFYINLTRNFAEMREGQHSYRQAESYAPPQPEPAQLPSPWKPPVKYTTREGTTLLDMNERPLLPDPQAARVITPPVVAEILRASIEEYGGQWSRRKLMRLRVAGQKVSRGMYEELTSALHQCGVLRQNRQGGFELPHDVETFEDLQQYFPGLPELGETGGGPGRDGDGGDKADPPTGGVVSNLAERRRQRFLECDCSVEDYLRRKGHD